MIDRQKDRIDRSIDRQEIAEDGRGRPDGEPEYIR